MTFNEANTVEAFVRDLLCGGVVAQQQVREAEVPYGTSSQLWQYLSHENLPRQNQDVLVVEHLRQALIRLNPSIAAQPNRVEDVLYRLREIIIRFTQLHLYYPYFIYPPVFAYYFYRIIQGLKVNTFLLGMPDLFIPGRHLDLTSPVDQVYVFSS